MITGMDVTSYYFEINSANWKHFIPILADSMVNARFDSEHLASEMRTVVQELKMNEDNYWRVMLLKQSDLAYPSSHPYHFPIIGYKEGLVDLTADRLKSFYKKYYQPNRATLFVVGDVEFDEVEELARKYFEPIKSTNDKKQPRFPYIIPEPVVHKTKIYKEIDKPMLAFYWLIPGLKDKKLVEQEALEFILGGSEGSRLYHRLVDKEQVASSVVVGSNTCMQSSILLVLIEPKEGQVQKCRSIVEEAFRQLLSKSRFEIPRHLVLRRQEHLLSDVRRLPDYHVYKSQDNFNRQLELLAEKQLKEEILVDHIAQNESITVSINDSKEYLNLFTHVRLR